MNTLLRAGLAAAAAYLIYRQYFVEPAVPGQPSAPGPDAPAIPTGGNITPSTPAPTPAPDLRSRLQQATAAHGIAAGSLLNFDEWNWFYAQVRGVAGPTWEAAAMTAFPDRNYRMTVEEYLALVTPLGLKGLACACQGRPAMGRPYAWRRA